MNNDNEEPMAKVAGKLIQTKKFLEQNNLLDTKNFEGFGKKKNIDPALRLRKAYATQKIQMVIENNKKGFCFTCMVGNNAYSRWSESNRKRY